MFAKSGNIRKGSVPSYVMPSAGPLEPSSSSPSRNGTAMMLQGLSSPEKEWASVRHADDQEAFDTVDENRALMGSMEDRYRGRTKPITGLLSKFSGIMNSRRRNSSQINRHSLILDDTSEDLRSSRLYSTGAEINAKSKRLLDRNRVFEQSAGTFNIRRRGTYKMMKFREDWFHSLIHFSTPRIFLICSIMWIFFCVVFAPLYYHYSDRCNMGMTCFNDAYVFSVYTFATIGYGAPDYYFNGCKSVAVLITLQSLLGIMLDTLILGILFTRIARAQRRATTVIYSKNAVIRQIGKKLYFMFQVCEMRKHQMSEAHVRLYAVKHQNFKNGKRIFFQTHAMRLIHPNDELGGTLLLALPSVIVHEIDPWSPLFPKEFNHHSRNSDLAKGPWNSYNWPEIIQRQADADSGERSGAICEACGGTFHNKAGLQRHIEYSKIDDRCSGHLVETSCDICGEAYPSLANVKVHRRSAHQVTDDTRSFLQPQIGHSRLAHSVMFRESDVDLKSPSEDIYSSDLEQDIKVEHRSFIESFKIAVQNHLVENRVEVLILLEANDAATSGTCQSRHSYTASDIEWDKMFTPCVSEDPDTGGAVINFNKFHDLEDLSHDLGDLEDPEEWWTQSHS